MSSATSSPRAASRRVRPEHSRTTSPRSTTKKPSRHFAGLEPVTFTYKEDKSGDLQLGFLAEDVPELVTIPSRKGVAPMDLIALLTKIVQQQQERLEALETRFGAPEKKP